MVEEEHPAFPYTDAFRKAKRNSLIWSGITIAAALGSPPVVGGEATLGQLGLSLTYDKSVLIGISGTAAIFMAFGFYQAYKRITLHASQLFAGKSDVAEIFAALSKRASDAVRQIDDVVKTFHSDVRQDASQVLTELEGVLKDVIKLQHEEAPLNKNIVNSTDESRFEGETADLQLTKMLPQIRTLLSMRAKIVNDINERARDGAQKLERFRAELGTKIANAAVEQKQAVEPRVHDLASTINSLTRFHDGIYRSEKIWFWTYDVAPVGGLFALAMIPFVKLFFA